MAEGSSNMTFSLSLMNGSSNLSSNLSLGLPGLQIDPGIANFANSLNSSGTIAQMLTPGATQQGSTGAPAGTSTGSATTQAAANVNGKATNNNTGLSEDKAGLAKSIMGFAGSGVLGSASTVMASKNAMDRMDKEAESKAKIGDTLRVAAMAKDLGATMPLVTAMKEESCLSRAETVRSLYPGGNPAVKA